ncbi:MAG TPA: cell wall anchor protein, partial [Micromonosporaceae bacterium]
TNVTQIAASGTHSMALKTDGTVWAWGNNYQGMLGDGTTTNRSYPVQVVGLSGVTQIAAGGMHSLALRSDGSVWSWGANDRGQLGDGTWNSHSLAAPATSIGGGPVAQVAAGFRHSIARLADGRVRVWGDNTFGQLGDGSGQPSRAEGVDVGLTNVTQVAAGWRHNLVACPQDGAYPCYAGLMFAWGDNSGGQLGDGTTITRTRPVQVRYNSNGALQLAAGIYHSGARVRIYTGEIKVITWGYNFVGQLGDTTTTQRLTPVEAYGLKGATALASGDYHMLAVKWIDMVICCG